MKSKGKSGLTHWLVMLVCCAVMLGAVFLIGGPNIKGNWAWLMLLLCPLAHLFMMRGMHNHGEDCHSSNKTPDGEVKQSSQAK